MLARISALCLAALAAPAAAQDREPAPRQVVAMERARLESGDLDAAERITALVRIGRAERQRRRTRPSRQAFADALTVFDGARGDDPELLRRVPDAIAEARFEAAEALYEAVQAERIRVPRGSLDAPKLHRWLRETFAPWARARSGAMRAAESAYQAVAELGPSRWSIAAARRVGDMYVELVDTIERIPVPRSLARDPQLMQVYRDALESQVRPLRERARQAYEHCALMADERSSTDPHAERCRSQLAALSTL